MFRPITLLAIFIVSLACAGHALADGKVFSKSATAKVNIPDQEALIHWADGVETLIIQTSFTGEGDEFAWVVPTPSQPEVTASTTGLFPTLRTLTAPKVHHPEYQLYLGVWLVTLTILGCAIGRWRETLAILVILFLFTGILMPSLGVSAGSVGVAGVKIHENGVVGDFEVAVLSADDPFSLNQWLNRNGFKTSAQTDTTIQAYIDDGWYFTAVQLSRDVAKDSVSATHPLAFRFPAEQPIYPLRLTATGSDALDVDLYVFGPERAVADNFDVAYCNRVVLLPDVTEDDWLNGWAGDETPIRHPELLSRVQAAAFVTKLSANLSPSQMSHDAMIRWGGEETYMPSRWTYPGARNLAVNAGWSCLAFTVLCLLIVFPKRAWYQQAKGKAVLFIFIGAIASTVVAGTVYMALPKIDAKIVSAARLRWSVMIRQLTQAAVSVTDPSTLDEYKDGVLGDRWLRNPLTGESMQIDDSPGNFTYEWTDDGLVITAYGPDGAPLRIVADESGE